MLAILLVGVCSAAMAQNLRNLFLKNKSINTPAGDVIVYTFKTKAQAERAMQYINEGKRDQVMKINGYISNDETDKIDGACTILMANDGYMVVDPEKLGLDCEVASTRPTKANGDVIYIIGAKKGKAEDIMTDSLKQIDVTSKRKARKGQEMVTPKSCGDELLFPAQVIQIDSLYARSNARVIVSPIIICDGKPVKHFPPSVMDGERYHNTQTLRMGNDITHDALAEYIVNDKMQDFIPTTIYTQPMRFKYTKGKKYRGYARISYENYRNVYHEEYVEWWDGSIQDPMQYLEFNHKKVLVPMQDNRYKHKGRVEAIPRKIAGLKVNFQVGKAIINLNDSATLASIEEISSTISSYYNNDNAFIKSMTIKGYASPEGLESSNRALSNNRAAALRQYVGSHFPNPQKIQSITSEGHIIPWSEVMTYLDSTYQDDQRVQEIVNDLKDIIEKQKTLDGQNRIARTKEWFSFVREEVFPQLRRVDIEYQAVANRILEPDEILANYKREGESYLKSARPYECYQLLKMFNDEGNDKELAKIAPLLYADQNLKEAVVRHERVIDSIVNNRPYYHTIPSKGYNRPYSFAAYCMVKEKLFRGEVDTLTLREYIDWSNDGKENEKNWENQFRGWWNDESIVTLQVLMYCQAKEYRKAYDLCYNHLPRNNDKFKMLRMFVRCLNCEWDDPEVKDYISTTSPQNKVAVLIAQDNRESYQEALKLLENDSIANDDASMKWYLNALCRFRLHPNNQPDNQPYVGRNCYDPDQELGIPQDFAAPMLRAFQVQPKNVERISSDGYFNDSYRLLVWYFWKYMQQNMEMEDIVMKYDAARGKYLKNHKEKE